MEGRQSVSLSRVYSDDHTRPSTIDEFEKRAKLPTVVMEEGAPLDGEVAHFVKLSDFVVSPTEVSFEMHPEPSSMSFPASLLDDHKNRHGLSDNFNWHHTCWQYGRGNIFETLYKADNVSQRSNQPKIFSVRQPPELDYTLAACMMPFAVGFDDVFSAIDGACSDEGLNCRRVDQIYNNAPIIDDIIDVIDRAAVVICDLTGKNPNVLYETGISHALGREVIILAQNISEDVPFDLRHLRCIQYRGANQVGRDQLRETLALTIRSVCARLG